MTTIELVKKVSKETGESAQLVERIIDATFKKIKASVVSGDNYYNRGFGSFIRVERKAKVAQNISKKTAVNVPARMAPVFKPSPKFKNEVAK